MVWESRGEDHSLGYAAQGEWRACLVVPERRCGGGPERRVHGWYWPGETPSPVRHILVSLSGRSLVPAGFSPHPMPYDIDGPAGSVKRPFSIMGFPGVRGW